MYETVPEEDVLELIYCNHCGSPIGKLGNGSRAGLICPKCREEYVISLHEGDVSQKRTRRAKRSG